MDVKWMPKQEPSYVGDVDIAQADQLEFVVAFGMTGPSTRIVAPSLDAVCVLLHEWMAYLGLEVDKRFLPEPGAPWQGAVMAAKSKVPRYGDMSLLHVGIVKLGEYGYFDWRRDEALKLTAKESA